MMRTSESEHQRPVIPMIDESRTCKRPQGRPFLAALGGPYSAYGQAPRLEEIQGPRAPDAFQGGARAAGADRAAPRKAAQSRHRGGNRRAWIEHRLAAATEQFQGTPCGLFRRAYSEEVDA